MNKLDPELLRFFSDFVNEKAPEGMEELSDVVKRTGEFLKEIKDLEGNILVFTHAIAMKGILEYLTPDAHGAYWSKYIGNCAVYRVSIDAERNIPVELAGGIVMNATTKAEVEEKVNSEYSVYNGSEYCSYTYTDYSGGFDLRLSIEVDKTSEKVSGITLSDKNWKY